MPHVGPPEEEREGAPTRDPPPPPTLATGYWLSYAPFTIRYVDIGPMIHDIVCHVDGARKRERGGTYRPPANTSVLVHNLKTPSAFGWVPER